MMRCLTLTLALSVSVPSLLAAQTTTPDTAAKHAADAVSAAGASAPLDPRAEAIAAGYQIGPEDVLDISVWKNPELSRTVPVRPDGMVSLPLLHDIKVAGLTPTELREELTRRFTEFMPQPEIAVIVREIHSPKIAVMGSVKTPGRYELKSPATVLEVIALAQGFTDFAARDRIVVLRQEGATTTRIPFNYRKVTDGDDQANFFVRPGDIVLVP